MVLFFTNLFYIFFINNVNLNIYNHKLGNFVTDLEKLELF